MRQTDFTTPVEAFTVWEGGDMPVPSHSEVEVRVRGRWPSGPFRIFGRVNEFSWSHDRGDPPSDVIGYRVTGREDERKVSNLGVSEPDK